MTLLKPTTGVFRIACICHMRVSSKPQLACRKALIVSFVGVEEVKFAGSGLGNTGAADGAGAAGDSLDGACAAAAGACCWAATGRDKAISAAALARRIDTRIKLFLLILREGSHPLAYTSTLTAMGNLRPVPNDLEVTFRT